MGLFQIGDGQWLLSAAAVIRRTGVVRQHPVSSRERWKMGRSAAIELGGHFESVDRLHLTVERLTSSNFVCRRDAPNPLPSGLVSGASSPLCRNALLPS